MTPTCHCEERSDAAISTTPIAELAPENESRLMQNEPNSTNAGNKLKDPPQAAQLNNQSSIINNHCKAPAISEEHEQALQHGYPPDKPYPPQKPINHSQPKSQARYGGAESTNSQLKISVKRNNDLISRRNQGRSEAYNHPRRPIKARVP